MQGKRRIHLVKNLILHSILFEMHSKYEAKLSLETLLYSIPLFCRYTLIEIANAKLCARILYTDTCFFAENPIDIFLVCCIISRKFWYDRLRKNADSIFLLGAGTLFHINFLERRILHALDYSVGMSAFQIKCAIEEELCIDRKYKISLQTYHACMQKFSMSTY